MQSGKENSCYGNKTTHITNGIDQLLVLNTNLRPVKVFLKNSKDLLDVRVQA